MRDVFAVWRNTRQIVLVALTAAIYAAVLIPFKAFPILIPGITEIRPANVIPVVCSLLFGPAAAWGAAFGNLIGDFFGTIGPGSLFGFVGNFLLGYLPYRLWQALSPRRRATGQGSQVPLLLLVAVLSSAACAVVIGFGVDLLGIVPYAILTPIILLNNAVVAGVLGPVLLPLIYPRARRWGLLYEDVLETADTENGPLCRPLGAPVVTLGCVLGLVAVWLPVPGHTPTTLAGLCAALLVVGAMLLARRPRLGVPHAPWEAAAGPTSGPLVEVEQLSFRYADAERPALRGVCLSLEPRRFVALMGRTGAGKSTLCLSLTGLIPHFQRGQFDGQVRVRGRDTRDLSPSQIAEVVGLLFQDFETQLFSTEVTSEVAFALENRAVPREEMERRVADALGLVGLAGREHRDPGSLSGGQRQRLALASVLCTRPPLLALDEATSDLDPAGQEELLRIVTRMRSEGTALVWSGHEPERARAADALVLLDAGQVIYQGEPADLLRDGERCWAAGVRPLDSVRLFMLLNRPERPLTPAEGAAALEAAGCELDREQLSRLDEATPAPGGPLVEIEEVHFSYGGPEALAGVSLTIRAGEFVAILGQNGSGKTTLARHLNALLRPSAGTVRVKGVGTEGRTPADFARAVGYVFQNPDHQIFAATVRDEVAFGPRNMGHAPEEVQRRVREALEAVGLSGREDEDPFALTKGERQRVAVASVLALGPELIILDEPTTGLDGPQQQQMMDLLQDLNRQGHTIVIITHSMWAAASHAHRVVLMHEGRVLADLPARELFGRDDLLAEASLRAPEIVQLGRAFCGGVFLTPEEMVGCVRRTMNAER